MTMLLDDNPVELCLAGYETCLTPEVQSQAVEHPYENHPITVVDRLSAGWFVAQVKSKREKELATFLASVQIPYFLPLTVSKPRSKSSKPALVPFLPGFLFIATPFSGPLCVQAPTIHPNDYEKMQVESDWRARSLLAVADFIKRKTKHTWNFLFARDRHRLTHELVFLASESPRNRRMQEERSLLIPKGSRCKVSSGPFKGLECVVEAPDPENQNPCPNRHSCRIFVKLSLLGRTVSAEISPESLELI